MTPEMINRHLFIMGMNVVRLKSTTTYQRFVLIVDDERLIIYAAGYTIFPTQNCTVSIAKVLFPNVMVLLYPAVRSYRYPNVDNIRGVCYTVYVNNVVKNPAGTIDRAMDLSGIIDWIMILNSSVGCLVLPINPCLVF